MFLRDFINDSIASLESLYPSPEARNIVMLLCKSLLGVKSYTHITEPHTCIPSASQMVLDSAMTRLLSAEPLQYVLGFASFYGRDFRVTPDVLIPRPETEILVSCALSWMRDNYCSETVSPTVPYTVRISGEAQPPCNISRESGSPSGKFIEKNGKRALRVLDLCTGSGCIAWTLALEMPGTEVVAVDISDAALEIAKSQTFEVPVRPRFIKADVLDAEQDFDHGKFDIILSNPPYIMNKEKPLMRSNILDYEPHLALFVEDSDPLVFYRAAARWAQRFLVPGGAAFFEINESLGEQTAASILSFGFQNLQIHRDFANKFRIISFCKPH